MIECFLGDDYNKIKKGIKKSTEDTETITISTFKKEELENMCDQGLLFNNKKTFILNNIFIDNNVNELVEILPKLVDSKDVYIIQDISFSS